MRERDLRKLSPEQLERYATAWLARNDPKPKQRHEDEPAIEWSLSPVCAEVECADDDALEIAATFADLAGGRLSTLMCAALSDEHHRGMQARREYMRETRAHRPDKRREWREREKQRRRAKSRAMAQAAVERELAHQQRRDSQRPAPLGKRRQQRLDSRQLGFVWAA
jgi:hypothetical protein